MINRVERLVNKVEGIEGATLLEKFITNMQRERAEVAFYIYSLTAVRYFIYEEEDIIE